MAATKVVTVLDNNTTLTAGGADHDSDVWTLDDGYGALLDIKITNGATGPTVAAQAQIYVSPDNSNWYKCRISESNIWFKHRTECNNKS